MCVKRGVDAVVGTVLFVLVSMPAHAVLINFNATGVPDVTGFVQFDDADFDGTNSQSLSNSNITDLALIVFGETYTLADVVTAAATIIDSSGMLARIVSGSGNLADNGIQSIGFFPDGFGSTPTDGDATLGIGASGDPAGEEFFAVRWVPVPSSAVPEPSTGLLLAFGLVGAGFASRYRLRQ